MYTPADLNSENNRKSLDTQPPSTRVYGPEFDPKLAMADTIEGTISETSNQAAEIIEPASQLEPDVTKVSPNRIKDKEILHFPGLPPTQIPPEMFVQTAIQIHDHDIVEVDPFASTLAKSTEEPSTVIQLNDGDIELINPEELNQASPSDGQTEIIHLQPHELEILPSEAIEGLEELTFLHPREFTEINHPSPRQPTEGGTSAISTASPVPSVTPETVPSPGSIAAPQPNIQRFETSDSVIEVEEIEDFDLMESQELTIEQFIQKKTLHGPDMENLLWLIQSNFENQELWQYIGKMAKDPQAVDLIKANLNLMTPKLLDSIVVIGGAQVEHINEQNGETQRIKIYYGDELGQGAVGQVSHIHFVAPDSLELKDALIKKPQKEEIQKNAFLLEKHIAQKVQQLLKTHAEDPRTKNILNPHYVGEDYLIMPRIHNEFDESTTLERFYKSAKFVIKGRCSIGNFCNSLAGVARGLDFLSEHRIIVADNKLANIVDSRDGGVIIDLGGFVDLDLYDQKIIKIAKAPWENSAIPIYVDPLNAKVNFSIPMTPTYGNSHILCSEIAGKSPLDLTHKLTLAKCLERFFCHLKLIPHEEFSNFGLKSSLEKLKAKPVQIDDHTLATPAMKRLYHLYQALYNSHLHPYKFIKNEAQNGPDPQYVSLTEVSAELNDIANNLNKNV